MAAAKRIPWLLRLGIAFGGGLWMGLTPAPANAWPLAWIALAPLWFLTQVYPPKASVLLGIAWGMGYHGLALSWITGLHPLTWMGVPWLASLAIVLFCWIFITLWGAALAAIWAGVMAWQTTQQPAWNRIFIGVALWCALEWLWSQSPLWWTSLAYTQSPHNLVILHLGQLSGPLTVTAALVLVNGLVAEALVSANQRWHRLGLATGLLIGLHLAGLGLYSRPLVQPPETGLKVGIIQGNIPNEIKLYSEGLGRALEGYTTGYQKLANKGVEAVLAPEGAFPFLWVESNWRRSAFYQAVLDRGVVAWLGTFGEQQDNITQSLLTITGKGEILSRYNKVKLVPLGEYIPFEQFFGGFVERLSPVEAHMLPGQPNQHFDTPFGRAIVGICYDSAFPGLFRTQAAAGGRFILTASNNDPYGPAMLAQHHAQDVMRAIETDRWAVRATNTGYSGVVDPHGNTRWLSGINTYEIHAATVYRRQTQTLYVRWGNWLTPLFIVLAIITWIINPRNSQV